MLSRVAESVYWLNRYVERAENVARFIDVNQNLTLGEGEQLSRQWAPLVYTTGDHDHFSDRYGQPSRATVLQFLVCDRNNPNSILSCVARARENARCVREVIPVCLWEQLNKFYLMVVAAADDPRAAEAFVRAPNELCERVKLASQTLAGITQTAVSHNEAWHFAHIGRLIERADKTSRIVDVQYFLLLPNPEDVGGALDVVRWSALLKSASALEMYRREHGRITPARVADFLILNRSFPRSMHFCVIHAQESLRQITGSPVGTFNVRSEQLLGRLRSELDYTHVNDVVTQGMHEFVDRFQQRLNDIGQAIHLDFFTRPMLGASEKTDFSEVHQ
jgi:uncharacterized alpha-E superfamily protein